MQIFTFLIAAYMLVVSTSYLGLFLLAVKRVRKDKDLNKNIYLDHHFINSKNIIPVSILVPSHNEEAGISGTVRSLLSLNYPEYEILIIDDGSTDQTTTKLIQDFVMEKKQQVIRKMIDTKKITAIYESQIYPHVKLIIKNNGGKSDALNTGINASKYPYFCSVDGDSILEADALYKTMQPIRDSHEEVIVTGGSIRVGNGSKINKGKMEKIGLPQNPLEMMQIIEYFRGFLIGRISLSNLNILLIVSGAFGLFNKEYVIKAGGYKTDILGEDVELIVRLHRLIKEEKSKKRIEYVPDPICWTEAPDNFRDLHKQRVRWQTGLGQTIILHRKMLFNPKYKGVGLLSLPYFLLIELLSGVIETAAYLLIISGLIFSFIEPQISLFLFVMTMLYGSLLSSLSVLLEEWTMHKYPKVKHLLILFFWALTESLWYRPFLLGARLMGFFNLLRKKKSWGTIRRKGISLNE